jgi:TetR/AcrR family transcriptional regulator, repressor of fatR-cypB operon
MAKVKPENEDSPKREAILQAALELFAEYGYHGTAVPQVADRARVGAGTVYRYFESKEALVNALFQIWKGKLGRALIEDFPVTLPMRAKFAEIWRRLAAFGVRHPVAFAFLELHHHGSYLDKRSLAVEEALLMPLRAFAAEAQRTGEIKALPAEMLGALVFGSFTGLVLAARKGLLHLTPKTIAAAEQCMWEAIRR